VWRWYLTVCAGSETACTAGAGRYLRCIGMERRREPLAGSHCGLSQGSYASSCALIRIQRAYDRIRQAWNDLLAWILAVFAAPMSQPLQSASVFAK
jgi:hypothetical protein